MITNLTIPFHTLTQPALIAPHRKMASPIIAAASRRVATRAAMMPRGVRAIHIENNFDNVGIVQRRECQGRHR